VPTNFLKLTQLNDETTAAAPPVNAYEDAPAFISGPTMPMQQQQQQQQQQQPQDAYEDAPAFISGPPVPVQQQQQQHQAPRAGAGSGARAGAGVGGERGGKAPKTRQRKASMKQHRNTDQFDVDGGPPKLERPLSVMHGDRFV
jgi:hypothetical protein